MPLEFNNDLLRRKRLEANLTLEELGLIINTTKSYIWELENNRKCNPSFLKIARLAHYLKVDLNKFYKA